MQKQVLILIQRRAGVVLALLLLPTVIFAAKWVTPQQRRIQASVRVDLPQKSSDTKAVKMLFSENSGRLSSAQLQYNDSQRQYSGEIQCDPNGQEKESKTYFRDTKGGKSQVVENTARYFPPSEPPKDHSVYSAQNLNYADGSERLTGKAIDFDNYEGNGLVSRGQKDFEHVHSLPLEGKELAKRYGKMADLPEKSA